jgi:hypothetical protein
MPSTNPALIPSIRDLLPGWPQLGIPPDNVLKQLTSGLVRVQRRVEIYEADMVTPWDVDNWDARLVDGSITVDRERDERRMFDFSLDNTDNALKNNPRNGFWYDKILKAFWGIKFYDTASGQWIRWETPLGVFMIDRIGEGRFPNTIKVTGRDLSKKCIISGLSQTIAFPQGVAIETIIQAVAANAGITNFALPITGNAYAQDIVFTRGTARWKVIKDLADLIGYEVYFRPDGVLTMRQIPDPTLSPVAWSFTNDFGGSLVDYDKSTDDSRVFNHIIVTGAALGAEPSALAGAVTGSDVSEIVFAEAMNTDPASPTRIARIGDRTKPYESDYFTSVAQAQDYANLMLRIASLEEYDMNFSSLIIPFLDVSDIVEIEQSGDDIYTPSRFLLSSFTVPMSLGPMTGVARRTTITGSKQNTEFQ